jgi:hypothetical protein
LENSRPAITGIRGAEPGRPAIQAAPEVTGLQETSRNFARSGDDWTGEIYPLDLSGIPAV